MLTEAPVQYECTHRSRPGPPSSKLTGPVITISRGNEIYGEKEPAEYFYTVVSGVVRTYTMLLDGRRQVAAFYIPGDVFGFETEPEYMFSAEAVTEARLIAIKRSTALTLAEGDRDVAQELWAIAGRELHRTQHHSLLLILRAPERVASFLLEMAERIQSDEVVELPMKRRDIADYLGLTIETLSRVLTGLERVSTISLPTAKTVVLRNREALSRLNN